MAINLLPDDLSIGQSRKVYERLNQVGIIIGASVVGLGLLAGGYIFLLSQQIRSAKADENAIIASISALETTENSFTLVRDRIDKIKPIVTSSDPVPVPKLEELSKNLPFGVVIENAKVENSKIEVSFIVSDSKFLKDLFSLISENGFKEVKLKSFSFNGGLGFVSTFEISE